MSHDTFNPPEAWFPVARAAQAIATPLQRILAIEAASGIILLASAAAALVWANLWTESYEALWHTPFGLHIGAFSIARPLHFWINDGLMTIFFFVVGLEIRREVYEGELTTFRKAALPIFAAIGGMLLPAGIYALLNTGRPTAAGWAIPVATDIAFAVGILTLLGSRVSVALRVLLLALAVIDDIGAIVVIAVFYSGGISLSGIAISATALFVVLVMRWGGVRAPLLYVIPGIGVWCGLLVAGLHPTIAGVLLGLMTPVRPWFGPSGFEETTREQLEDLPDDDRGELRSRLALINRARREAISPADRLIHDLHPWVAFAIIPLFALANAGVELGRTDITGDSLWLFIGVILGLAVGKPAGIFVASISATRLHVAARARDVTNPGVLLVGLVGGVGFTMSLFIAQLAFPPGPYLATAKLAILIGSGVAILAGLVFGLALPRRKDG